MVETNNPAAAPKKPPRRKPAPTPERQVLYPEGEGFHVVRAVGYEEGPLTQAEAKAILGWETMEDFVKRTRDGNPAFAKLTDDQVIGKITGWGKIRWFKDEEGQMVTCWNNSRNRPFGREDALKVAQDVLNRHWRFNWVSILIGQTGWVVDGQHRLVGFVFACQLWQKQNVHWQELWPEKPVLETCIAYGAHEDRLTFATIDNTRTRTDGDVISTSGIFDDLDALLKQNACRSLNFAADLLWKRTHAGRDGWGAFHRQRTRSESINFIDRHPKLIEAVKVITKLNGEHVLNGLHLSPGRCAGMLYLMGSSDSDLNDYRNAEPPREMLSVRKPLLDWSRWDRALSFWSGVIKDKDDLRPIRKALEDLKEKDGAGSVEVRKLAVFARAWDAYKDGELIPDEILTSEDYVEGDVPGLYEFKDESTFGGIDQGEVKPAKPKVKRPTPAEVEAAKEVEKAKKAAEFRQRIDAAKARNAAKDAANGKNAKPMTRKEREAEQTRLAAEADALLARERDHEQESGDGPEDDQDGGEPSADWQPDEEE